MAQIVKSTQNKYLCDQFIICPHNQHCRFAKGSSLPKVWDTESPTRKVHFFNYTVSNEGWNLESLILDSQGAKLKCNQRSRFLLIEIKKD